MGKGELCSKLLVLNDLILLDWKTKKKCDKDKS